MISEDDDKHRMQEQVRLLTEAATLTNDWLADLSRRLTAAELKIIELENRASVGMGPDAKLPSRKGSGSHG